MMGSRGRRRGAAARHDPVQVISFSFFRSIRARLVAIILASMLALVGLLVYQHVQDRSDDRERAEANLQRLARFAAQAERERFNAAERLLAISAQAGQQLRAVALAPDSQEAYDRCTSGLFVLDQLLPETSGFALWDTNGDSLCSSKGAERGEYSVANHLWFTTARERGGFSTGGFELAPPDGTPSIGFGLPIRELGGETVIAYISAGLRLDDTDALIAGTNLPETGALHVVDQNGIIIGSSDGRTGETLAGFTEHFGSLNGFLEGGIADAPGGRTSAAVRVTDGDDARVAVVVGADSDALATPLAEALVRDLVPVVLLAALSIVAVWLLGERWIVRPVESLVDASAALAGGELSARARGHSEVSEFERLREAFNDMAATRERASHAKDEFLGLVSHELRTPITTVLGNAEILRHRSDRLDDEQKRGAIEDIHESALGLTAIIDNLLSLARLERGAELETEPLVLVRQAQASAEEVMRREPGRRVVVSGDPSIMALAGETHVDQVLRNLIGNAVKYSPPETPVEVSVDAGDGSAMVRVYDRGKGIDESEREAVFEPFYRSTRTASFADGMGIGLSVCKRLIEALDGSIWCKARPGGGSEFGFSLPLATDDTSAMRATAPLEPATA